MLGLPKTYCSERSVRGVVGVIKIVGLVVTLLILQKHGKG